MVLLQSKRPEVSNWASNKPGNKFRLLESHRQGPRGAQNCNWSSDWDEEDISVLQRKSSSWGEDQMGPS